jgi:hypothetical protein
MLQATELRGPPCLCAMDPTGRPGFYRNTPKPPPNPSRTDDVAYAKLGELIAGAEDLESRMLRQRAAPQQADPSNLH